MERLVSVIIPVYGVEQYLDRCLESIINQSYENLEIILVDDGSPDSCPQKCDEWARKDTRIKVIHKQNAGIGFARNSGLDIASGDYVMFVDSDDYISLDAIKIMVRRIEVDQSDLVIAKFSKVYTDGAVGKENYSWIVDKTVTKDEALNMIGSFQGLPVYAWGKLYRRTIFSTLRYQSLKCAEDVYILPYVIEQCEKVSLMESVVYFYFQRDTSIVHTKSLIQIMDSITASLHVSRFFLEHGNVKAASLHYCSAICQYFQTNNSKEAKKLLTDSFNKCEKKLLRRGVDIKLIRVILAARFPAGYRFYKVYIKK